jgi:hypothetical protein
MTHCLALPLFLALCLPKLFNLDLLISTMHLSAALDNSSRSSETKFFGIEFSDLHVSKEDFIKPWCDQLDAQLFEAKDLADEHSVLVPADVAAIVDSSLQEPLRIYERWQLSRQSDRAGSVETCGNLIVQALVRALVIEHSESYRIGFAVREGMPQAVSSCLPLACDASAHDDRLKEQRQFMKAG